MHVKYKEAQIARRQLSVVYGTPALPGLLYKEAEGEESGKRVWIDT